MRLQKLDKITTSNDFWNNTSLSILDLGYCLKVRTCHVDYINKVISLDKLESMKKTIQKEYIQLHSKINQGLEVYKHYQEAIEKSELLRSDINKSSNLNDMLLKSLEYISLTTGDKTFYDINVRKF